MRERNRSLHAEREEHEKIEAARVAAEKEEAWKVWRAAKRAEKWKAAEEAVGEDKVVVVDGPSEQLTAKSNVGLNGEPEMEAVETACK